MNVPTPAQVYVLPMLVTDPAGYNDVVAGRRAPPEVAGPNAFLALHAETRRSIRVVREITDGWGAVNVHTSPFLPEDILAGSVSGSLA